MKNDLFRKEALQGRATPERMDEYIQVSSVSTFVSLGALFLFMLGVLMAFNEKINFFAFILILHWAVIAMSKIGIFNIPEDAILAAACIPAMVIFYLQMLNSCPQGLSPSTKTVKILIVSVAAVLAGCMFIA